jgi:hypothetical protein
MEVRRNAARSDWFAQIKACGGLAVEACDFIHYVKVLIGQVCCEVVGRAPWDTEGDTDCLVWCWALQSLLLAPW